MPKYALHPATLTLAMVLITSLFLYLGSILAVVKTPLLPKAESKLQWMEDTEPQPPRGKTRLDVIRENHVIDYEFYLSSDRRFPYTAYNFNFSTDKDRRKLADLSHFKYLTFDVSCSPRNILILVLFTFDEKATNIEDSGTFRINSQFFTCDLSEKTQKINLATLDTPDWWLQNTGLELVDREYDLEKVISFGIVNSLQSPRDTHSKVTLSKLTLTGINWVFVGIVIGLVIAMWASFIYWLIRRYIAIAVESAKARIREDMPLIAYQKLSVEPHQDKKKGELLRYLATEYANPEMSLELAVNSTSINRNKINEILKEELGLTFTGYINKLRLTESSRLLSTHPDITIGQIAYKVGFNNVTYFNKLFKDAYGCSPKHFKNGVTQPKE